MDKEAILKELLSEHFNVDPAIVVPQSRLEEDLGLDEIDQVEFQIQVEKRFGIIFTPYQTDNINTIQDCLDAINNKEDRS